MILNSINLSLSNLKPLKSLPGVLADDEILSALDLENRNDVTLIKLDANCERRIDYRKLDPFTAHVLIYYGLDLKWELTCIYGSSRWGENFQRQVSLPCNLLPLPQFDAAFFIPWKLPLFGLMGNLNARHLSAQKRIRQILSNTETFMDEDEYHASYVLVLLASTFAQCSSFEAKRLKWEQQVLMRRMQYIVAGGPTAMNRFLVYNEIDVKSKVIRPTFLDRYHYALRNRDKEIPSIWFKLPMEQVPQLNLPVQQGFVHISFLEMPYYLLHLVECQERHFRTLVLHKFEETPNTEFAHIFEELVAQIHAARDEGRRSFAKSAGFGECSLDPLVMEDLVDSMPPCLRPLAAKDRGAFPQDQERQYLVRIAHKGRVPLEAIGNVLDKLNEKYPHQPMPLETLKRWNFVAHYNKDYAAPRCENLPSCMTCPFTGRLDQKKAQCHALFRQKFPDDVSSSDSNYFFGPASWLYWRLRNYKKIEFT